MPFAQGQRVLRPVKTAYDTYRGLVGGDSTWDTVTASSESTPR